MSNNKSILSYRGFKLDPFQIEAIQAIENNQSVLVSAPTGAGKTLIAEYALEKCLREGKEIIYTAPLKAISNQKFRDFSEKYQDRIGILTGDVSINPDAPALIMTTEIFRNNILINPKRFQRVSYVIFDELHYLDDEERGTVWEESIIFAPAHIKIIALSATVPNLMTIARWIKTIRHEKIKVIKEENRPVPLKHLLFLPRYGVVNLKRLKQLQTHFYQNNYHSYIGKNKSYSGAMAKENRDSATVKDIANPFSWGRNWKDLLISHIIEQDQLPCLYFVFNRKECEKRAENNLHRNLLSSEEQTCVQQLFEQLITKYGISRQQESVRVLFQLISRGIAYHHAGMLPSLKEIVEQLFTKGLIKLLFATETFALGVNMPARSVVFDELIKFDGKRDSLLLSREYHQMAGRAGRRGMDKVGFVYSNLSTPFIIKAPVVEKIIQGKIEPINSQFNLSYASLLSLYQIYKDKIYEVCQKSLSNFQPKGLHKKRNSIEEQVRCKVQLLKKLGYIKGTELTPKGHFARQIYGYELILTELANRGILYRLKAVELVLLAVAIVFEARGKEWCRKINFESLKYLRRLVFKKWDY